MIRNILVVCTGNICRSPIGEALLRSRLPGVEVASAGTSALVGEPADGFAIAVSAESGIDLSAHRAQQLTAALVRGADVVLTMEVRHKRAIVERYPFALGRVFQLDKQSGMDVPDPYMKPFDAFRHAYSRIERGVNAWVPTIVALK
ncbi:low molecular weight protein-tyrosine-phosphatase [Burkholderia cepacia]|uniref:low molecular weight protein-tyrosine-phosphatase n=1 Tax=Burkholderia cepacia TaxID=292 RepID=UPI00075E5A5C|nr:low molecular weight protein-tyrosine-phosphatase [Burkholderia cepacia]KVW87355.1 protein tyrosine phosphatase [Burkholderia cepacia]KVX56609.1 protein tyrosine phosphatase [Burkholderia cepacia]KVX71781.1 protein tyrosine phosphatase [Burkholderia cepacia]KWC71117.1 protein tyrosine phosphatase [Burkholderia cepacia]KWD63724.1 protein tyrosine phosphatase [Burkholderia cepacia]